MRKINIYLSALIIFVGLMVSPRDVYSQIKIAKNSETARGEDSPFGIFDPYEVFLDRPTFITRFGINEYLRDLGVRWVQAMPREDIGELDTLIDLGFNVYSRAVSIRNSKSCSQRINDTYKENLKYLIRKYKDKIKYWEADTEPEGNSPYAIATGETWGGCPEEYAKFLKVTYEIIKDNCNDCKVVFGGLGGPEVGLTTESHQVKFLDSVLKATGGKYFDAFEFKQHYHKANEYTELRNKMEVYGKTLSNYGIDIYKIPVFIETAMYDGKPVTLNDPPLPYQSELQEAAGLIKTYVFGTAQGIDKIFWNNVVERGPDQMNKQEIFNCYGFVNNPDNDGQSHKKLSYYAYKKMVEALEGSDWNNIQTIQGKDGICIYKFIKQGKPIWVAWNDNPQESQITISDITSNQVNPSTTLRIDGERSRTIKITEAIPKYASGKEVMGYGIAFKIQTKTVKDAQATITLNDIPVFVEEE